MAKSSIVKLHISVFGDGNASPNACDLTKTNTASPGWSQTQPLSSGTNSMTVPTGCTKLTIQNSTQILYLQGNSGDTGWAIPVGEWVCVAVTSGATILIKSTGASTADFIWS